MHTVKKKVRPCAENNTHRRVAKATFFLSDAVRSLRSDIYAPRPFTRAIRGTQQADFRASTNLPVWSHE